MDINDVFSAIFGQSVAKGYFFLIILLLIGAGFLLFQQRQEVISWKLVLAVLLILMSVVVANSLFNMKSVYTPYQVNDIWLGNSSENITQKDYDRLYYLQDNLAFAKRSWCDTPSRFDYSDDGSLSYLDDAGEFYKSRIIEPQWDVHVYTYNNTRIFRIILFYANQRNVKHDLDFEYIEMYYKLDNENMSDYEVPDYVSFPTYEKLVSHPRVFLAWSEMPVLYSDIKCLAIDPDTNSFSKDYGEFPSINRNYRLDFVSPDREHILDYLTETEKLQVAIGLVMFTFCLLTLLIRRPDRIFLWSYLTIMFLILGVYPILSLRYDFITDPTFRVWTDSTPSNDAFVNSESGRFYMNEYGIAWDRSSWSQPDNTAICV